MPQQALVIRPLDDEQQQRVIEETHAYINRAATLFNIKKTTVNIAFDLKGRAAGMYRVQRKIISHKREIRYNPYIFSKYFDDNFRTTIPHEVAHFVSDLIYGLSTIKPHGKEWKEIMRQFDSDPTVTASYDLAGIPKKNKTLHSYMCSCRQHQLGTTRHNRIIKQHRKYICNICKQVLYPTPPTTKL